MTLALLYDVDEFGEEDLFRILERDGHNVNDVLFAETGLNVEFPISRENVPGEVLQATKGDRCLFVFGNRGRGAGDGLLECPNPGLSLCMYNAKKLRPFVENGRRAKFETLETTSTYYAQSKEELKQAFIGSVNFI